MRTIDISPLGISTRASSRGEGTWYSLSSYSSSPHSPLIIGSFCKPNHKYAVCFNNKGSDAWLGKLNEAKYISTPTILEKKKASRAIQKSQFEALSEAGIQFLHNILKAGITTVKAIQLNDFSRARRDE